MKNPSENPKLHAYQVSDIRMRRPIVIYEKKSGNSLVMQPMVKFKVGADEVSFSAPNNVSIFVSISRRELRHAKKLYESLIAKESGNTHVEFQGRKLSQLYNYLEHIQSSIVSIYTAIESLANVAIPIDFKFEKINNKGATEIRDKNYIERWVKTSE